MAVSCSVATPVVAFLNWPVQQLVDRRPDPYNYAAIASQMVREGFAAHGLTKREASLYPIAIAAVYRAVGESPLVIVLAQCLLFAATCALACDLAAASTTIAPG